MNKIIIQDKYWGWRKIKRFYLKKVSITCVICIFIFVVVVISNYCTVFPKVINVFARADRLLPIYRVQSQEKKVAISFDAAWGSDITPKLLEILRKNNIKTTFFLVKFWMDENPEMTRRIAKEGHEIGNHSASHPNMGSLSKDEIIKELTQTHEKIKELTGQNANLFRPPFGDYSNILITTCNELGYNVIQWDVDSLDWKDLSSSAIYDRVIGQIKPGSIVLFHNNGKHTAEALEPIMKELSSQGYQVVPISEILIKGEHHIDKSSGEMRKGII